MPDLVCETPFLGSWFNIIAILSAIIAIFAAAIKLVPSVVNAIKSVQTFRFEVRSLSRKEKEEILNIEKLELENENLRSENEKLILEISELRQSIEESKSEHTEPSRFSKLISKVVNYLPILITLTLVVSLIIGLHASIDTIADVYVFALFAPATGMFLHYLLRIIQNQDLIPGFAVGIAVRH